MSAARATSPGSEEVHAQLPTRPSGRLRPEPWSPVPARAVARALVPALGGGSALLVLVAETRSRRQAGSLSWWWDRLLALQSHGLLSLASAAAVAAVVGMTWSGRRPAADGVWSAARRVAAVFGCQALAVLVLALLANNSFDFYSSWSDLLGTGSDALVLSDPSLGSSAAGGAGAGALLANRRFGTPDPRPGRVVTTTVPGARTGLSEQVAIYLPPQYDQPGAAHRRFRVVLALSGYPGALQTLEGPVAIPATMNTLLSHGAVSPMVIVMAMSAVTAPRDTECTDVPGGPQVQTFFAQDLPQWISAHYRVDQPGRWGVLGISTGGFCAAKLVLSHPEVFRAAASLSGTLSTETDITTGDLFGGSLVIKHENDPLWRVAHLPPPPVSLLLTATRQERGVYPQVARFLRIAQPPLQVSSIIRATGGHNAGVWRSEMPLCLQWLATKLPQV